MNSKGLSLVLFCTLYSVAAGYSSHNRAEPSKPSWFTVFSCVTKQVPKLPEDFNKSIFQYMFEVFARNTHLLPLGVPMNSKAEDYQSTAEFESCLYNIPNPISSNTIEGKTDDDDTAYNQLFARRQGGYDYSAGLSLLGGKMVASMLGYVVHILTVAPTVA